MKIKCLVVDDEPLARDLLEGYIHKTPFLELVGKCRSAIEAMQALDEKEVDLLFLDIQMPELSGMEWSQTLSKEVKVIFTTAFEQYALEGYKVNALDYLLKPFNYPEFLKAANKAKEWFELVQNQSAVSMPIKDSLLVNSEYKLIKVELKDILYFEGLKDYVKIFLQDIPKPILSLMSLKHLEEQLPADRFMRVHRSYIVNLDKISTIERSFIQIGKAAIPIAEQYKERFQGYLSKNFLR
jgi:DNA-binding LytR/AlgR family response regulator